MIFLAALVAVALVVSPAAYAAQDTKVVNSTVTTFGPGADIAVASDGTLFTSFGEGSNVQVYKGSAGSALSTQRAVTAADSSVRLTAIGLTNSSLGKDTPVVVAVFGNNGRNGVGGGDTWSVNLYYSTTSSNLAVVRGISPLEISAVAAASDSLIAITGLDLVVDDSYIIIGTCASASNSPGADSLISVTKLHVFRYDNAVNAPTLQSVTTLDSGASDNLQLVLDPVEKNTAGTTVVWGIRTKTIASGGLGTHTSLTTDTGVAIFKAYIVAGAVTQVDTQVFFKDALGVGDSRTIGRLTAENVSGSDTRAGITICLANTDSQGSGRIRVLQFRDSRHTVPQPLYSALGRSTGTSGDTIVVSIDTGTSNYGQASIRSMAYGRNSTTHAWVLALAATSDQPAQSADTIIAVTQSDLGSSSFSADTAITGAGNDGRVRENLSSAMSSGGSLYTVGWDDGPNLVWYTTQLGGESSKKKDSAVCLMDRLFGKTSMRAVFPGLKTFRDTLLGTDLGRKIVSLYYTF